MFEMSSFNKKFETECSSYHSLLLTLKICALLLQTLFVNFIIFRPSGLECKARNLNQFKVSTRGIAFDCFLANCPPGYEYLILQQLFFSSFFSQSTGRILCKRKYFQRKTATIFYKEPEIKWVDADFDVRTTSFWATGKLLNLQSASSGLCLELLFSLKVLIKLVLYCIHQFWAVACSFISSLSWNNARSVVNSQMTIMNATSQSYGQER